jgi:trigger factor
LRSPIFEEKVVDHVLALARIEDRKVTRDELMKPIDDDLPGESAIESQPPVA